MMSSVNVALPAIQKYFSIDAVLLSWVATSYLLAAGVSLVPFGRLADIYGRKKMLIIGFTILSISSLFSALATSSYMLIIFRAFQGVGSGMIYGTGMAILVSVFPPNERGKVLGISVSAVYIGLSTGPFIGGILTQHFTWRSLFLLNFLLCIAIVILILLKLKGEWADAKEEKFDIEGAFLYGATLIAIIYGFSNLPSYDSIWIILSGCIGLIIFIMWETRIKHPVFEVYLFKNNKTFALSNLAALIHYSSTFGVTFLLSLYLQYIKAYNPQSAGTILMSQPIMMALFSPFAGKLSDKIEPRIIASIGMGITSLGILFLTTISESTGLIYIIACLMLLGFGFALFSSPNMNAIMSSVEKKFLGLASGSAGTMRVLGQIFSMGVATLVLAIFMGRKPITKEIFPSLLYSIHIILFIFVAFCFMGIFASLSRGKVRK
ncbi:MAG: MFS transporter [Desulfobacterales bacterium]|nr:MFS transporter [Desulfobacterales bacterium]